MANTKFEMILKIPILKISNIDVSFDKKTLIWKFYIINKALPTTEPIQIADLKKFVIAALDVNSNTFMIHMAI